MALVTACRAVRLRFQRVHCGVHPKLQPEASLPYTHRRTTSELARFYETQAAWAAAASCVVHFENNTCRLQYACSISGCNANFVQKDSLVYHMKSHRESSVQPFICPVVGALTLEFTHSSWCQCSCIQSSSCVCFAPAHRLWDVIFGAVGSQQPHPRPR